MLMHIQPFRQAMRVARGERGVHAASLWLTMLVAPIAPMGPLVPWGGMPWVCLSRAFRWGQLGMGGRLCSAGAPSWMGRRRHRWGAEAPPSGEEVAVRPLGIELRRDPVDRNAPYPR